MSAASPPRWTRLLLPLLLVLVFLSRVLVATTAPYDVDAVLFARGVVDFDPTAMRPHAPGYPLVIALARLWPGEGLTGLRLVAAAGSTALVGFGALAAGALGPPAERRRRVLGAAWLLACLPVVWFYGAFANAYAGGAAGAAALLWLALRDPGRPRDALWMGVVLGLTAGLRPSLGVFLLPTLGFACRDRWRPALAGLAFGSIGWFSWCSLAAGGPGAYLRSVVDMFLFAREDQAPRLHQWHRMLVYLAQSVSGGVVLAPLWRPGWRALEPRQRRLLLLWAVPAFTFHSLIYLAKAGYLLAYLALPVLLAMRARPHPRRLVLAGALSAALFLLGRPMDPERDALPRRPFAEKSWPERLRSEASFLVEPSLARLRQQDAAQRDWRDLVLPLVDKGRTVLLFLDRWDPNLAVHALGEIRTLGPDSTELLVPPEGVRLIVVGWDPVEGLQPRHGAQGMRIWWGDLTHRDLPFQRANLSGKRVD